MGVTKKAADDAVMGGNQVVKNPFVNDASGNLMRSNRLPDGGVAVPSLQFWDYVKRGLDDQIGAACLSGGNDDSGRATYTV